MYKCLKPGGRIAIHWVEDLADLGKYTFKTLNPENYDRLMNEMYQLECKDAIEGYCKRAGFEITHTERTHVRWLWETTAEFLEWAQASNHGLFTLDLVNEERMRNYHPPRDEKGRPLWKQSELKLIAVKVLI